ncbi:MAG: hypothetical protein KDJ14_15680 [Xanthomonadales bacterium]|nr:hypothetical protein [Xanthomonadales bacterium]
MQPARQDFVEPSRFRADRTVTRIGQTVGVVREPEAVPIGPIRRAVSNPGRSGSLPDVHG